MPLPSRRHLLPLLAAAALLAPIACRRAPRPVAEVEGQSITHDAFQAYFSEGLQGTDTKAALDALVRLEVAWVQAERANLLKGDDWKEGGARVRRQVITKAYLQSLPGLQAPSEEAVRSMFLSHSEERHVFHILVGNEQNAKAARKRLEQGEAFEKVATAISTDPSVAQNKGNLGWLKRQVVLPEFANAVWAAEVGQLCGPFHSDYGWHVALVKERRAPDAEAFEKNKARLMASARDMALKPIREDAAKPLRAKYPVKVNEGVVALNPTPTSMEVDGKRVVGEVCGESISLGELLTFIKESMGPGGMDHAQSASMRKRFLELMADEYRLVAAAEKAGITKKPTVQANLWLAQHKAVRNGFGRYYLLNLKPADADLAPYHQAHPEKFKDVGAVNLYLLVAKDNPAAVKAAEEAKKGTAWKSLVGRYANLESTGKWDPGFLAVADLKKALDPDVVQDLSNAPVGTLVGPVEGPEGPMLFKILDRRPGEVLPLEQCREQVRMDYLETEGEKLLQTYLDGEGRKGLKIKLYPENLKP